MLNKGGDLDKGEKINIFEAISVSKEVPN